MLWVDPLSDLRRFRTLVQCSSPKRRVDQIELLGFIFHSPLKRFVIVFQLHVCAVQLHQRNGKEYDRRNIQNGIHDFCFHFCEFKSCQLEISIRRRTPHCGARNSAPECHVIGRHSLTHGQRTKRADCYNYSRTRPANFHSPLIRSIRNFLAGSREVSTANTTLSSERICLSTIR